MNTNEPSHAITIKETNTKRKRFDSIGTPDSPFRILLLNLFKKTTKNDSQSLTQK